MLRTRPWVPYLYAAPVVALLLLVFGYPLVRVFDFSFRRIRGDSGPWIGLENYRLVLDDPTFREAVKHSALLLLAVPVMVAISVLVALVLYERMRGWRVYRSVLFIPYILAVPIVGIVASYMFQFNGVVNSLPARRRAGRAGAGLDRHVRLGAVDGHVRDHLARGRVRHHADAGPHALAGRGRRWRPRASTARAGGSGCATWSCPRSEGAVELYVVIASITMVAWVFAYIWTITKGGPGDATVVLELYIYNRACATRCPAWPRPSR